MKLENYALVSINPRLLVLIHPNINHITPTLTLCSNFNLLTSGSTFVAECLPLTKPLSTLVLVA